MSRQEFMLMKMICSAHKKRGEEVVEFNLNPHSFKKTKLTFFSYDKKIIPIVSEGWEKIGVYYYKEYTTTEGVVYSSTLTYRLK